MIWGLRLGTRVWDRQRVAKEESPCQILIVCKVEFHLVKRLCALATDCTARLNQRWRPRSHHADGCVRRMRAESKTPKSH